MKLEQFLEQFRSITDGDLKQDLLIELAEQFKEVPPTIAFRPFPPENKVPACESEAYIWLTKSDEGKLKFYFAVENPQGLSAKALAVILDQNLSETPVDEILGVKEEIVYQIFGRNLSMGKGAGLMNMVGFVRNLARLALAEQSSAP